jgi:hypothetical protein
MQPADEASSTDIRDQLRRDHQTVLAELEALRHETDDHRCQALLARLRRSWMIDTLAKESVVYRAIEGIESANDATRADQRFVEHELVEGLFEKLSRIKAGSLEWHARLNVARELIMRLIETEYEEVFGKLAQRYDAAGLAELGESFGSARAKLAMLEEAKAA